MKKILIITVTALFLGVIFYFGIVRSGFTYYTGIGTPYSYFAAKKASHDSLLIVYDFDHCRYIYCGNTDSLRRIYGFTVKVCYSNISPYVLRKYNFVIEQEIKKRIGIKKWSEYEHKKDSMFNKAFKEHHLFLYDEKKH